MWYNKFLTVLLCGFISTASAQLSPIQDNADERLNVVSFTVYGLAPLAVYERIVPFNERVGLIGSAGLFYYGRDTYGYSLGATLYMGSPMHRGELGGVYLNETLPIVYGAYRYTRSNGLFAKGGLGYTLMGDDGSESGVVPILAIGYAF